MKKILPILISLMATTAAYASENTPVYLDPTQDTEARVEDALSRMTLQEKINLIHAQSKFSSYGVPRLGIPEVWATDGPHGIRPEVKWDEWDQAGWTNDSCVAFPALTCLAATWNPEMSKLYGKAIGEEARYRNKTILLGPGVNMYRTPLNGRNFEYMGEDPYLASKMVVPYIQGVQENGVAACVKHFALNNQENHRHTTNVAVDDRALYEIYLPAFHAAVTEGNSWSIMGAYNLYNDQHLCHNQRMLNDILKGEWGYDGVVVSDWGGTHDTKQAIEYGLDLEFGTGTDGLRKGTKNAYDNYHLAYPYFEMIANGGKGTEELNDKARRVLRLIFRTTMSANRPLGNMCSEDHYRVAREIGGEGIVLLRNENNILPIDTTNSPKILLVGENAIKMMTVGGGSSSLKAQHEVTPIDGLKQMLGNHAKIDYARGYVGDTTGKYNGVVTGQNLKDDRSPDELIKDAVEKAKGADYVIFFGGLNKSGYQDCEGVDRKQFELPYDQDNVIEALAEANPNLIVVNISGNAVAMPWSSKTKAIVQAWYLGSEAGNAIADVLTGRKNPSGKLPFSFPMRLEDVAAHASRSEKQYPGVKREGEKIYDESYDEGIFTGYRWHDSRNIKPLYPFGHGLSYTEFTYGKATTDKKDLTETDSLIISVPVTNTGSVAGAETVQLYISDLKSTLPRPTKELKGFSKVYLNPGETKTVTFTIGKDALSYFDPESHQWVAEPGKFKAHLASSSADIKSSASFELKK